MSHHRQLFQFYSTVNQIPLAESNTNSDHFFHEAATITGWGTNEQGILPQFLQYAEVYVMSDEGELLNKNNSLYFA